MRPGGGCIFTPTPIHRSHPHKCPIEDVLVYYEIMIIYKTSHHCLRVDVAPPDFALCDYLPIIKIEMCNGVEVIEVMLDLETATWTALRETLDNITII